MNSKKLIIPMLGLALLGGIGAGIVGMASADSTTTPSTTSVTTADSDHGHMSGPGVAGTVSSVSGTTITVTDTKSNTAYTVDVSSAKIMKSTAEGTAPTTATVSDVLVGDTIMVRGTVSGTSVVATDVMDGKFEMHGHGGGRGFGGGAMGTVTSINGSTVVVTDKDGGVYTIDATSAKIEKNVSGTQTTVTLANIAVGDTVMVHGKVTTANVTADSIMDGVFTRPTASQTTTAASQ